MLKIHIDAQQHVVAVLLPDQIIAVYDSISTDEAEAQSVLSKNILFKIIASKAALRKWPVVGSVELNAELQKPVPFFWQNFADFNECYIEINGHRTPVKPADCQGLERLGSWDAGAVEQRIRDHYAGMPNAHVEALKVNAVWR